MTDTKIDVHAKVFSLAEAFALFKEGQEYGESVLSWCSTERRSATEVFSSAVKHSTKQTDMELSGEDQVKIVEGWLEI